MSILNWYQLALIATIIGTIVAANLVRKRMPTLSLAQAEDKPIHVPTKAPIAIVPELNALVPELKKFTAPVTGSVKEKIRALDKLFDENVISVEEYVELRKRALG